MTTRFVRGPVSVTVHEDGALEVFAPSQDAPISKQWALDLLKFLYRHYGTVEVKGLSGEFEGKTLVTELAYPGALDDVSLAEFSEKVNEPAPAPKRRGRPPKAQS